MSWIAYRSIEVKHADKPRCRFRQIIGPCLTDALSSSLGRRASECDHAHAQGSGNGPDECQDQRSNGTLSRGTKRGPGRGRWGRGRGHNKDTITVTIRASERQKEPSIALISYFCHGRGAALRRQYPMRNIRWFLAELSKPERMQLALCLLV